MSQMPFCQAHARIARAMINMRWFQKVTTLEYHGRDEIGQLMPLESRQAELLLLQKLSKLLQLASVQVRHGAEVHPGMFPKCDVISG